MRVVVTGAGGFSGSHIVPALLGRGHDVTAVVRTSRGRLTPAVEAHPRLTLVSGDLSGALALPSSADAIVHTAASSPAPGITDADMERDNVGGTSALIDYARSAGARTFIYLSSLSIYGEIAGPVVDEATPIVQPDVYGETKHRGELLLRQAPFRSLSIRLPGVLGPHSVRNWLTGVLAKAKAGEDIAIYHPDAPYNNAIHVADLADLTVRALEAAQWTGHDSVTVGAAGMTTVRKAVDIVIRGVGSQSRIEVRPPRQPFFTISSERAQRVYGYTPMEIEALLRRFVAENRD